MEPLYEETKISYTFQRIEGSTIKRSPCSYLDLEAAKTIASELMGNKPFQMIKIVETYQEFIQE